MPVRAFYLDSRLPTQFASFLSLLLYRDATKCDSICYWYASFKQVSGEIESDPPIVRRVGGEIVKRMDEQRDDMLVSCQNERCGKLCSSLRATFSPSVSEIYMHRLRCYFVAILLQVNDNLRELLLCEESDNAGVFVCFDCFHSNKCCVF